MGSQRELWPQSHEHSATAGFGRPGRDDDGNGGESG